MSNEEKFAMENLGKEFNVFDYRCGIIPCLMVIGFSKNLIILGSTIDPSPHPILWDPVAFDDDDIILLSSPLTKSCKYALIEELTPTLL